MPTPHLTIAELFFTQYPVTADELFAVVSLLADDSMRGRRAGSLEEQRTADYLAAEFARLGLEPGAPDGGYIQTFPLAGDAGESRNVLAWLPGTDLNHSSRHLLIGAHIDHLGTDTSGAVYNGADDNASGVAALLGMARAWHQSGLKPRYDVLLVGFGAEEQGLQGSRYYVAHPVRPLDELTSMINLDMLGRGIFLDISLFAWAKRLAGIVDGPGVGVLSDGSPRLLSLARCSSHTAGLPSYSPDDFPLLRSIIDQQAAGRGDFMPFWEQGIPYVFFSTSVHDDYHRISDTAGKIDSETLWRIAGVAWRTAMAVDLQDDLDPEMPPLKCPSAPAKNT